MAVGVWMLLAHAGLIIPHVAYKGFDAYGLPIGFLLIAAAILVLWLWKLSDVTETITIPTTKGGGAGGSARTAMSEIRRVTRHYRKPPTPPPSNWH
jgi:hypothetical protein